MTLVKKILSVGIRGVATGASLAMLTPTKPESLGAACDCEDTGSSIWQCTPAENACVLGDDVCKITCTS